MDSQFLTYSSIYIDFITVLLILCPMKFIKSIYSDEQVNTDYLCNLKMYFLPLPLHLCQIYLKETECHFHHILSSFKGKSMVTSMMAF